MTRGNYWIFLFCQDILVIIIIPFTILAHIFMGKGKADLRMVIFLGNPCWKTVLLYYIINSEAIKKLLKWSYYHSMTMVLLLLNWLFSFWHACVATLLHMQASRLSMKGQPCNLKHLFLNVATSMLCSMYLDNACMICLFYMPSIRRILMDDIFCVIR